MPMGVNIYLVMAKKAPAKNRKIEQPEEPTKMGRPEIDIDIQKLKNLCQHMCTLEEIASIFDCSEDTIERRIRKDFDMTFAEFFARNNGNFKLSVRRAQIRLGVEKLNGDMLKHLGKNYLGQSDKIDGNFKHSGNIQTTNLTMDDVKSLVDDPEALAMHTKLMDRLTTLDKEHTDGQDPQKSKKG